MALKRKCSPEGGGGLLAPSWVSISLMLQPPPQSPPPGGRAGSWEGRASRLPPGWEVDPQTGRLTPANCWQASHKMLYCISQLISHYTPLHCCRQWDQNNNPSHMKVFLDTINTCACTESRQEFILTNTSLLVCVPRNPAVSLLLDYINTHKHTYMGDICSHSVH